MDTTAITRREFARLAGLGLASAAAVSGKGWGHPLQGPLALIGCGQRGRGCFEALGAADVAMVCDVDRTRGAGIAAQAQALYTDRWQQCMREASITGVVIAVSDACVPAMYLAAIENGKRVFLDCSDSILLAPLVTTLSGQKAACQEGVLFAWSPAATAITNLIHEGHIGALRFGHATVGGCAISPETDSVAEAHVAQLFLLMTALQAQTPCAINAIGAQQEQRHYSLMTALTFDDGMQMNITSTTQPIVGNNVVIRGTEGRIEYENGCLSLFSNAGTMRSAVISDMRDVRHETVQKWHDGIETSDITGAVKTIKAIFQQTSDRNIMQTA